MKGGREGKKGERIEKREGGEEKREGISKGILHKFYVLKLERKFTSGQELFG